MRKTVLALALALAAAASAETPSTAPLPSDSPPAPTTSPPTTPGNPDNASNPAGAPVPPKKWEMRDDQRAHRGECLKLTKQIARYDRDRLWAKERGNELWELSNQERVYRLAAERQRLCPSKQGLTTEQLLAKAADVAARLALAAYTHGWLK
jgi:hypothetical protein